jgi:hypothetical protein
MTASMTARSRCGLALVLAMATAACQGSSGSSDGGGSTGGQGGTTTTGTGGAAGRGGSGGSGTGGAATGGTGAAGSAGSCIGAATLSKLGKNRLLVGVSTSDAAAAMAPFDLRYIYLSGGIFDSTTPCTACGSACTAGGKVCTNGCSW